MQEDIQTRQLAIAVKSSARQNVDPDWQSTLTSMPGVRVVGASTHHVEVEATPKAAEELRSKLGDDFLIEEELPRRPA